MKVEDPGYRNFIPPDQLRRMSKIIRMGITAARVCLKDAEDWMSVPPNSLIPDSIITGTGWGCLDDTAKFLTSMVANNESLNTPTSFIQSTHNTVAGQLALILKCQGYNFTYVHRGISFESALLDSVMQLNSGEATTVLAGGGDELHPSFHQITSRLGWWKHNLPDSNTVTNCGSSGSIPGEGVSFILLENTKKPWSYARVLDIEVVTERNTNNLSSTMEAFLSENGLTFNDIDILLPGITVDFQQDRLFRSLFSGIGSFPATIFFKQLSGEYPSSTAFATLFGALLLHNAEFATGLTVANREIASLIPWLGTAKFRGISNDPSHRNHILICNSFMGETMSFILLSNT
jgi:3-oxoacyl-(acyl-carrier-protein) synthase